MTGALNLREATGDDAAAMLAYVGQVAGESDNLTFGPGDFSYTLDEERSILEASRSATNRLFQLALRDGEIIGVLVFNAGDRPRLRHVGEFGLSVLKRHWGTGIGGALLDGLIGWAEQGDVVRKINLTVRRDNSAARALYRSRGFVEEGVTTRGMCIDGVFHDLIWMGREVDPKQKISDIVDDL